MMLLKNYLRYLGLLRSLELTFKMPSVKWNFKAIVKTALDIVFYIAVFHLGNA